MQEGWIFELRTVPCVGECVCEYARTAAIHASETICAEQAAIIAGVAHAHIDIFVELPYHYSCNLAAAAVQPSVQSGKSS